MEWEIPSEKRLGFKVGLTPPSTAFFFAFVSPSASFRHLFRHKSAHIIAVLLSFLFAFQLAVWKQVPYPSR
jgi:hypothetical protein